jgi:long-subunit fatty acid transport protein
MFTNKIRFFFKLFLFFVSTIGFSQATTKSVFWEKVQFGGGLGLGFGTGFTNIAVAPSAIYNVNQYFATGLGLQYNYLSQKIQFSTELEQLRVTTSYENPAFASENFWNTALFLGVGYRTNNVTIGGRYNVLYKQDRNVYGSAFMPFVRVFF